MPKFHAAPKAILVKQSTRRLDPAKHFLTEGFCSMPGVVMVSCSWGQVPRAD